MKNVIPIPCTGDFAQSQSKSADPLPNLGIVTLSQHWEGASLLPSAATVPSETPQSHEGIYIIHTSLMPSPPILNINSIGAGYILIIMRIRSSK